MMKPLYLYSIGISYTLHAFFLVLVHTAIEQSEFETDLIAILISYHGNFCIGHEVVVLSAWLFQSSHIFTFHPPTLSASSPKSAFIDGV